MSIKRNQKYICKKTGIIYNIKESGLIAIKDQKSKLGKLVSELELKSKYKLLNDTQ